MHPQQSPLVCSQQLVAAHSVSRSSSLAAIAENGHVMQFGTSLHSIFKHNGQLVPTLIGINRASTFTGFCHSHDSQTFSLIDQPITLLSLDQIFLAAYRSMCRELFTKTAVSAKAVLEVSRQLDKGKGKDAQQIIQDFNGMRELGLEAGLRDLRKEKSLYDASLLHKDYAGISYYVVTLDHAVPITCAMGFTPEIDFHGNRLQRLDSLSQHADSMTCSILKTTTGTAIIFAWLSETNGACSGLVESLHRLKDHQLPSAIVRLVFEYGENVFFSPSWWNSLDDTAKKTIMRHANSLTGKPDGALSLDGSLQILWSIVDRKKVLRQK